MEEESISGQVGLEYIRQVSKQARRSNPVSQFFPGFYFSSCHQDPILAFIGECDLQPK